MSGTAQVNLHGSAAAWDERRRAALSHTIRLATHDAATVPMVTTDWTVRVFSEPTLPTVVEQSERLILALGRHPPGRWVSMGPEYCALIGAVDEEGLTLVLLGLHGRELIDGGNPTLVKRPTRLSLAGWERFEELRRGRSYSNSAFMAMAFNRPDVERAFRKCFVEAAADAGFDLRVLNDPPKGGLIDNELEVSIRTARFLVVDLTHDNDGAYWEAGFGAGLGKQVFYTCERTKFETEGTHFDVSHHYTILWSLDDLAEAKRQLTAVIRANLPGEAKMSGPKEER